MTTIDDPFETGDALNDLLNDGERLFQALVGGARPSSPA